MHCAGSSKLSLYVFAIAVLNASPSRLWHEEDLIIVGTADARVVQLVGIDAVMSPILADLAKLQSEGMLCFSCITGVSYIVG